MIALEKIAIKENILKKESWWTEGKKIQLQIGESYEGKVLDVEENDG